MKFTKKGGVNSPPFSLGECLDNNVCYNMADGKAELML